MKTKAVIIWALAVCGALAFGQDKQKPMATNPSSGIVVKALSDEQKELLLTKLKLAIANAQLAQNQAQVANQQSQQQVMAAQALIEKTRIDLGYDETYGYDFTQGAYVKIPTKATATVEPKKDEAK